MNTNVKAVINLMQTLGVTLEDLLNELPVEKVLENIRKKIENDSINMSVLFSSDSKAFDKLIKFIGGKDFGTPLTEIKPETKEKNKIVYNKTRNGITYASYNGIAFGLVIEGFILALRNQAKNVKIDKAKQIAASLFAPEGKQWIIPYDAHWRAVSHIGMDRVNNALRELNGDIIDRTGFLSSTSQANQPSMWYVRFILPLD